VSREAAEEVRERQDEAVQAERQAADESLQSERDESARALKGLCRWSGSAPIDTFSPSACGPMKRCPTATTFWALSAMTCAICSVALS
jgi:hypothetical protein